MNLKVSNLIAIQLGVLVGIMSWLAYSRLESAKPRLAALETRESPATPAAVIPVSDLGSQVTRALNDGADREQDPSSGEQPAPATLPHQYSPEAVQQYVALATQQVLSANRSAALRQRGRCEQFRRRLCASLHGGGSATGGDFNRLRGTAPAGRIRRADSGCGLPAPVPCLFQPAPLSEPLPADDSTCRGHSDHASRSR